MFELAVSCINTEEPPKRSYGLSLKKKNCLTFLKVADNDKHSRFKQAVENMQKTSLFQN